MADNQTTAKAKYQDFFDWLYQLYGADIAVLAPYLENYTGDLSKDEYLGSMYTTYASGVQLAPQKVGGIANALGAALGGGANTMRQNFPGNIPNPPSSSPQYSVPVEQYFDQLANYLDYNVSQGIYTEEQAADFFDKVQAKANAIAFPTDGTEAPGPNGVDVSKLPFFSEVRSSAPAIARWREEQSLIPGQIQAGRDVAAFNEREKTKFDLNNKQVMTDQVRGNIEGKPLAGMPEKPMPGVDIEKLAGIATGPGTFSNLSRYINSNMGDVADTWEAKNPNARQAWWDTIASVPYYAQLSNTVDQAYQRRKELEPIGDRLNIEDTATFGDQGGRMSDIDRAVSESARAEAARLKEIEDNARKEFGGGGDWTAAGQPSYEETVAERMKKNPDPYLANLQKYPWYEKFISQAPGQRGFYSRTYRPPSRFSV